MGRVGTVLRRLLWIVILLALVLVSATGAIVAVLTIRGFPTTTGTLTIPGLDHSVSVLRDAAGIPWIEAQTTHDLFLAQGYVHAQDRMWQMEVWRHISAGRLSELFGSSTLTEDRFIRTLGWRQAAERDLAAIPADGRAALDAYSAGVNAWIDAHQGSLSLPFVVTGLKAGIGGIGGYHLEPWTDVDTLSWQKVQAWQLGGNYDTEVFRMLADAKLGDPARTDELFPAYPDGMPIITPSGLKGSGGAGATAAAGSAGPATTASAPATALDASEVSAWRDVVAAGDRVLQIAGLDAAAGLAGDHEIGSNDFVVAPSKSQTRSALLGNDVHLGIGMPSVWYLNGLRCQVVSKACPFDVAGFSFPGVPGVVTGHNEKIAWGLTNVDPDVEDLFSIDRVPDKPAQYQHGADQPHFDVRQETIQVAGGQPVQLAVRETVDGPILNDVDSRLANAPLVALRWTATDEVDGTFEAFLHVDAAGSFSDFRAALKGYGAPSQNFVYADVAGHIGYVLPGRIPIRADPTDHGDRIRSGSDGRHDWTGTVPVDALPWQFDPPSGMIVTANNAPVDGSYPYFLGDDWDPGYRASRMTEQLQAAARSGGVSMTTIRNLQFDDTLERATSLVPVVAAARPVTQDGALLAQRILSWDQRCPPESTGCAAYEAFEYRLLRGLFDDELGSLAREYVGGSSSLQAMIDLLDKPNDPWWDDVTTPGTIETRDQIAAAALDEAGRELRAAVGDPDKWTWGTIHTATFEEQTLGSSGIGPLEWYFNQGPFAAPGAAGAVNNTYSRIERAYPDPDDPSVQPVGIGHVFDVTNLPAYRLAVDLGDLDGARVIQTTGQSGNPFDRHYGDFIGAWLHGDTVPLPFSPGNVHAATVETLTLVPPAGS